MSRAVAADFSDFPDQANEAGDADRVRHTAALVQSAVAEPHAVEVMIAAHEMTGVHLLRAQAAARIYATIGSLNERPAGHLHLMG